MNISELLIPELKHETERNEAFFKRVPADKLEWAPHEKSMPMGKLCAHIVELYGWIPPTMDVDTFDMATYRAPEQADPEMLITRLHELAPAAEQALQKDNDTYFKTWTMKHGDKVLMQMPRYTAIRTMVMNQFPHHRAQLGVYLRLLGVDVPATYGPSADES